MSQHIMFDEISGIDCILTDLHVGFLHNTTTTKIRFKVDSGACANLLPFKVLKHIEPSVTVSKLHDSIDHNVCMLITSMLSNSLGFNTSRYLLATKLRLFLSILLTPDSIQ